MTDAPASPFTLLDLVALVRRRYAVAVATAALVLVVAVIAALRGEPLYQAQAKLALDGSGKAVDFQDDPDRRAAFESVLSTQREMLLSRAVAERAVHDGGLMTGSAYASSADPAGLLIQRLKAMPVRNAWVILVTLDDEDPRRAEDGLRGVLGAYLAEASQRARARGADDCAFLERQLAAADGKLAEVRERERAKRAAGGIVGDDPEASPHARALAELAPRLVDARARAAAATVLADQVVAAQTRGDPAIRRQLLIDVPRIAADPLVERQRAQLAELRTDQAALSRSLLPKHPRMLALAEQLAAQEAELDKSLATVAAGIIGERSAAEQQREALLRVSGEEQSALGAYRETVLELRRMAEERQAHEKLRDQLAQRLEQRRVELRMEERPMTVVDQPSAAGAPQTADRIRGIAVAIVLAATLGIAAALVADLLDRRLRGATSAADAIGAPLLAALPMPIPADPRQDPPLLVEAVRDLRAGLRRAARSPVEGSAPIVLVSGIGTRSMAVAERAACAFADAGDAVLLVDADLRQGGATAGHGLAQLLAGEPGIAAVAGGRANLDVMASGGPTANPAELLNSHCLPEWLGQVRQGYGLIVLAGADLAESGDAGLVAEHADAIVLVIEEGMTTREQSQVAGARLAGVRGRLAGVVVLTAPAG